MKIDKKTQALLACCGFNSREITVAEIANTVAKHMINNLLSVMKKRDMTFKDLNEYTPWIMDDFSDIIRMEVNGVIDDRMSKMTIANMFEVWHEHPLDYLLRTGLLDQQEGDVLLGTVRKILNNNRIIVNQIKGGNIKAVGSLMGMIMKETGGKARPKEAMEILQKELNIA